MFLCYNIQCMNQQHTQQIIQKQEEAAVKKWRLIPMN